MNFELEHGTYKSIKSLSWKDIPEFAVITGKNGTGKTQLLELINFHFELTPPTKRNIWAQPGNPFFSARPTSDASFSAKEVVYIPSMRQLPDLGATNINNTNAVINNLYSHLATSNRNESYQELANAVEARIGKPKTQITKTDIQENLPLDYFDYVNKIQIHEGLNEAFITYRARYAEQRDLGKPEDEIVKILGVAPWDVINNMLHNGGFPYVIKRPISYIGDYHFELISTKGDLLTINFSDLSAGEKVLLSLAIWMFNGSRAKRLPKLLLLDEPDAHLHPSAVKQFIDVVEKSLVMNYGVKVIMTTHSPSTVALAPEHSLFEMTKDAPHIKRLQSREHGISLLTEGLVVVKSNSKYVLVEDKNDAKFYREVFSILKNNKLLNENIPIVFIPASNNSANTSGGCTVVRSWVEKFVSEGVDDIFQGLMDYDNGTNIKENVTTSKNLHVICRYSLENYLLDPILIFCAILHDNTTFSVPGITIAHRDEHEVTTLPENQLQIIADYIFSKIESSIPNLTEEEKTKIEVEFINTKKLLYPLWFLNRRGHDLYSWFKLHYQKAISHENLLNALNRHQFIPKDLVTLYNDLQRLS